MVIHSSHFFFTTRWYTFRSKANIMNIKILLNKSLSLSMASLLVFSLCYFAIEPAISGAQSADDTVVVTLNVVSGIAITSPADTTMSIDLGVSQDTAVGTTTWNVKTNNAAGYTLAVKATATPAMQSPTDTITDYQTGAPNTWSVSSGNAAFGYSAFGTDVNTGTWGSASVCSTGTHVPNSSLNYRGFTTSDYTVSSRSATTTTAGIDTSLCYAVEQDTFYIPSGVYKATIVATATAN
jgi:hypothetical protein